MCPIWFKMILEKGDVDELMSDEDREILSTYYVQRIGLGVLIMQINEK